MMYGCMKFLTRNHISLWKMKLKRLNKFGHFEQSVEVGHGQQMCDTGAEEVLRCTVVINVFTKGL